MRPIDTDRLTDSFRDGFTGLWRALNPREPGPGFLVSFFAAALTLFVIAYLIGQA